MQHILLILLIGWSFYVPAIFTFVGSSFNPDLLVRLSLVMKIDGGENDYVRCSWYPLLKLYLRCCGAHSGIIM